MTATADPTSPRSSGPASGARTAIARQAFRQVRTGALVVSAGFAVTVAAAAISYVSTFPTEASRRALAAVTGNDTGLAVLLGSTTGVGTVGGYTVYKLFAFLTTIGAIWALLATTRLLRGEEEAGRWQLVLAGAVRSGQATVATLLALGLGVVVVLAGTTVGALLAGRNAQVGFPMADAGFYGLSIAVASAVFVAVGALSSQLSRTRRGATTVGMIVFGAAFVLRMVSDAGPSNAWVRWLTPFGWVEQMRPFTANDPWPLLPAAACVVALTWSACVIAERRDLGGSVFAAHDSSRLRAFGLGSQQGLALRLELPTLAGWCVGAGAGAFTLGAIARLTTSTQIPTSLGDALDRFGVSGPFRPPVLRGGLLVRRNDRRAPTGRPARRRVRRGDQRSPRPPDRESCSKGELARRPAADHRCSHHPDEPRLGHPRLGGCGEPRRQSPILDDGHCRAQHHPERVGCTRVRHRGVGDNATLGGRQRLSASHLVSRRTTGRRPGHRLRLAPAPVTVRLDGAGTSTEPDPGDPAVDQRHRYRSRAAWDLALRASRPTDVVTSKPAERILESVLDRQDCL